MNMFLTKIKKVTSFRGFQEFILNSSPKTFRFLIHRPLVRKILIKVLDKYLYRFLMSNKQYSKKIQEDKYFIFKALMLSLNKILDNTQKNKIFEKAISESVVPKVMKIIHNAKKTQQRFYQKYGIYPPGFLTISPTKFCNLKCTGCYANSSSAAAEKLDWNVVDKIITEKTRDWGSWFTVISGGEPFAYKSQGKGLLDLAKKHQDNYFLVYTNGTLITSDIAKKLAELGNITPAISIEGFEKETDARRGKGIHKKILGAMKNLKKYGVPFGISVTATRKNADLVTSDKLMNYYLKKCGASYSWMFQLMPIGRGQIEMMVTPQQRLKMFRNVLHLIKDKKYFIADFWNCGAITSGCISAGKRNGYLYVEWNGNVTPCVFNPYAVSNINDLYKSGKSLNDVLNSSFFKKIRKWQDDYSKNRKPDDYGNWILPCPMKDHYKDMKKMVTASKNKPIDELAAQTVKDKDYEKKMIAFDKKQEKLLDPVWEKEYLNKNK